jgi:hypothetical protein
MPLVPVSPDRPLTPGEADELVEAIKQRIQALRNTTH